MPLEISEIGINLQVSDPQKPPEARTQKAQPDDCDKADREQIVDDCVRRVLQILKNLGGR